MIVDAAWLKGYRKRRDASQRRKRRDEYMANRTPQQVASDDRLEELSRDIKEMLYGKREDRR